MIAKVGRISERTTFNPVTGVYTDNRIMSEMAMLRQLSRFAAQLDGAEATESRLCLAKTSYTRKMSDLAKVSIPTVPIRFLP